MSEDLILQVFARLAIIVAERDCDKDNDMKYHIDYENKRYDVTIEIREDKKMKDIDGYVTKDDLYRLISRIKRNSDVADDKTCHTIVNAISDMPSADVQSVRCGEWEMFYQNGKPKLKCTNCHSLFDMRTNDKHICIYPKFCEECGADMRGDVE